MQACYSRGYQAHASSADLDDLHNALSDKGLLKTGVGFIGGNFLGASDDSTIDVRGLCCQRRTCDMPERSCLSRGPFQGASHVCLFFYVSAFCIRVVQQRH